MTIEEIVVKYYYKKIVAKPDTDNTNREDTTNMVHDMGVENNINIINDEIINEELNIKTPNTGDTEPVVAISMIILVCMTNLCQISITNPKRRIRENKGKHAKWRKSDK